MRIPGERRGSQRLENNDQSRSLLDTRNPASSAFWPTASLNELVDLTLSSVDKKSKANEFEVQLCNYLDVYNNSFVRADMDFMSATATEREIARCALARGDVVITKDSEKHDDIGVPALIRDDIHNLVCGYHLAILRPRAKEILGPYLFYALSAPSTQQKFHSFANGVTRFGLRKFDIGLVEIPLPSLPEQRAIAHFLGTLDDQIEMNCRMNETLEEMARTLFKSWFVDFEPVRAKMEGRDTGLPNHIAELFPARFVDSEIGKIPESWNIGRVHDICKRIENGGTPKRTVRKYWNGDVKWFKTSELVDEPLLESSEQITELGLTKSSCKRWPAGTVLVALYASPTVGRLGILEVSATANQACCGLIPDPDYGRLFLFYVLRFARPYFQNIAVGAAQQNISQQIVRDYKFVIPSADICGAFNNLAKSLYLRRVLKHSESRVLSALRDALLPKLISGEIRVPEAERAVERFA